MHWWSPIIHWTLDKAPVLISGARVYYFSILDAKNDDQSSYFTMFNSMVEWFRYLLIPYGIFSCPGVPVTYKIHHGKHPLQTNSLWCFSSYHTYGGSWCKFEDCLLNGYIRSTYIWMKTNTSSRFTKWNILAMCLLQKVYSRIQRSSHWQNTTPWRQKRTTAIHGHYKLLLVLRKKVLEWQNVSDKKLPHDDFLWHYESRHRKPLNRLNSVCAVCAVRIRCSTSQRSTTTYA